MINYNKLDDIIAGYKEYFPTHWMNEKYKWIAVKHFQDNWDIDAPNFGEMFAKATSKAGNLLVCSEELLLKQKTFSHRSIIFLQG